MTGPKLGHAGPPQPHRTCVSRRLANLGRFRGSLADGLRGPQSAFPHPHLDNEVHVALVLITGDRGVRPDDQVAIDSGREIDVLAWGPCRDLRKGCVCTCRNPVTFQNTWEVGENTGVLLPTGVPMSHQAGTIPLGAPRWILLPGETFISCCPGPGGGGGDGSRGGEGLGNG